MILLLFYSVVIQSKLENLEICQDSAKDGGKSGCTSIQLLAASAWYRRLHVASCSFALNVRVLVSPKSTVTTHTSRTILLSKRSKQQTEQTSALLRLQ